METSSKLSWVPNPVTLGLQGQAIHQTEDANLEGGEIIESSEICHRALGLPILLQKGTGQLLESRRMGVTLVFGEGLESTLGC